MADIERMRQLRFEVDRLNGLGRKFGEVEAMLTPTSLELHAFKNLRDRVVGHILAIRKAMDELSEVQG